VAKETSMTDKDELPEEIRKKLLEEKAQAEADGLELDDVDLDRVAGGAYTGINTSDFGSVKLGRGVRIKK
jgi:hypothetical protein